MFHESPSAHQTLPYKPHATIEIPVGMKKFFPHQLSTTGAELKAEHFFLGAV
jgi:hypothetical protein